MITNFASLRTHVHSVMLRIPFLSTMRRKQDVVVHHDQHKTYFVVLKAAHGLVVCFGYNRFTRCAWPDPSLHNTNADSYNTQRNIFKDAQVYAELKTIEQLAQQNKIPMEEILFLDCSNSDLSPEVVSKLVRNAFVTGKSVSAMRSNALWPEINNDMGLVMTNIFLDEVVGKQRHEFCDLLNDLV